MSKHTPGPWIIDRAGNVNNHNAFESDFPIAKVGGPLSEVSANKRLIAAAPELLAALELVASYGDIYAHRAGHESPFDKIKAAIAKSRGEE